MKKIAFSRLKLPFCWPKIVKRTNLWKSSKPTRNSFIEMLKIHVEIGSSIFHEPQFSVWSKIHHHDHQYGGEKAILHGLISLGVVLQLKRVLARARSRRDNNRAINLWSTFCWSVSSLLTAKLGEKTERSVDISFDSRLHHQRLSSFINIICLPVIFQSCKASHWKKYVLITSSSKVNFSMAVSCWPVSIFTLTIECILTLDCWFLLLLGLSKHNVYLFTLHS